MDHRLTREPPWYLHAGRNRSISKEMSWRTADVAPPTMGCYFNDAYSVVREAGRRLAVDFLCLNYKRKRAPQFAQGGKLGRSIKHYESIIGEIFTFSSKTVKLLQYS